MDRIYAPWRAQYFHSKQEGCVFCEIAKNPQEDESNFVIYRDNSIFAVMNRYPYAPGHFMLLPLEHCDSPENLNLDTWLRLHTLSHKAANLLYEYGAQGINMGINIKKAGGAGIPEHLHIHFVPRFIGDTNFFTSIAESRSFGLDFNAVYQTMKALSSKHFVI